VDNREQQGHWGGLGWSFARSLPGQFANFGKRKRGKRAAFGPAWRKKS
jgi:hypothetical protein